MSAFPKFTIIHIETGLFYEPETKPIYDFFAGTPRYPRWVFYRGHRWLVSSAHAAPGDLLRIVLFSRDRQHASKQRRVEMLIPRDHGLEPNDGEFEFPDEWESRAIP